MSDYHGTFVWYELLTTDPEAACAFYGAVFDWGVQRTGTPGKDYRILSMAGRAVGGLMALPEDVRAAGAPPGWMGYVAVDDVDAWAERFVRAGGVTHRAAEDIPGVGRFAVVSDPQAAPLVLFKGASDSEPVPPPPGTPGHVGWHELYCENLEPAFAFYAGQFGWTRGDAMDMGAMGVYQLFRIGGVDAGGMMTRPAQVPQACWLFYFNVADIDAAVSRVSANAGRVLNGPLPVPGDLWIAQCSDPQGAVFCLVGPRVGK